VTRVQKEAIPENPGRGILIFSSFFYYQLTILFITIKNNKKSFVLASEVQNKPEGLTQILLPTLLC